MLYLPFSKWASALRSNYLAENTWRRRWIYCPASSEDCSAKLFVRYTYSRFVLLIQLHLLSVCTCVDYVSLPTITYKWMIVNESPKCKIPNVMIQSQRTQQSQLGSLYLWSAGMSSGIMPGKNCYRQASDLYF